MQYFILSNTTALGNSLAEPEKYNCADSVLYGTRDCIGLVLSPQNVPSKEQNKHVYKLKNIFDKHLLTKYLMHCSRGNYVKGLFNTFTLDGAKDYVKVQLFGIP